MCDESVNFSTLIIRVLKRGVSEHPSVKLHTVGSLIIFITKLKFGSFSVTL